MHLDITEMRGYQYHTGIVFASYSGGTLQPIAKGGRYDNIGSVFGLALPATGFSLDLRSALDLLVDVELNSKETVYVPQIANVDLNNAISNLKSQGYRVIKSYDMNDVEVGAKKLVEDSGKWVVKTSV